MNIRAPTSIRYEVNIRKALGGNEVSDPMDSEWSEYKHAYGSLRSTPLDVIDEKYDEFRLKSREDGGFGPGETLTMLYR